MLSCLSLLHHTHVRVARHGEYHRTACGLSVTDESGLFVEEADAATCDKCRIEPRGRQAGDPKSVVRRLFDEVLNTQQMFPGWHATIDDMIAEDGRVVALYHVNRGDGLADSADPTRTTQTVIFRVAGQRIVAAQAIVDDFALWTRTMPSSFAPFNSKETSI